MENANTTIIQWDGGDETAPNPCAVHIQRINPRVPDPETEAEEL